MNNLILLANNLIEAKATSKTANVDRQLVGTVVSNMIHFGYVPSMEVLNVINRMSKDELTSFWTVNESAFKEITGANRNMDKFVVYKNFPKEVLEKTKAEYWYNQILMYFGFPNEFFTEEKEDRPALIENKSLKVLALSKNDSLVKIFNSLMNNHARWSDNQNKYAKHLLKEYDTSIDLDSFGFKENGIVLIKNIIAEKLNNKFTITTATDVLRLAAAMSDGDIALRESVRFKKFARSERRLLLNILDKCKNITEDVGTRPELWKRFLSLAHPGDFKFKRVSATYAMLYNNEIQTFNKIVDAPHKNIEILETLKTRPGEFLRRLHSSYTSFGIDAVVAFVNVIPSLSNLQLVKLRKYVETINTRTSLMYPPKGNWARVQVLPNNKKKFTKKAQELLFKSIDKELKVRMRVAFPLGIKLDAKTKDIKLQTNDQKLAEYGRGTTFDIPENITFIRSASYWENVTHGSNWFDNGWNFFDSNWDSAGVVSWDTAYYTADSKNAAHASYWANRHASNNQAAAVFSGDPTNSKDLKGRACQMVDLYIDRLIDAGVRYAVWNVLCYSKIPFCDATDVLATLQMGEKPEAGKLYEPSRAQMVFPLKSKAYASYVAYIDLQERKLVYMDAPLKANVMSASRNGDALSEKMPSYVEYLNSLPSLHDLVSKAKKGKTPFLFTDAKVNFKAKKAFVFKPANEKNKFDNMKITELL